MNDYPIYDTINYTTEFKKYAIEMSLPILLENDEVIEYLFTRINNLNKEALYDNYNNALNLSNSTMHFSEFGSQGDQTQTTDAHSPIGSPIFGSTVGSTDFESQSTVGSWFGSGGKKRRKTRRKSRRKRRQRK